MKNWESTISIEISYIFFSNDILEYLVSVLGKSNFT